MSTWLLIPCHRPRLDDLRAALEFARHPAERTLIVTTLPDPIAEGEVDAHLVLDDTPGGRPAINIARWWNRGLDWIAARENGPYNVAVVNSDLRITSQDLHRLTVVMREHDLAMVGADWCRALAHGQVEVRRSLDVAPLTHRIPGVCMVVAGELGVRADERFRWWFADDDFEWQHRAAGGTGLVSWVHHVHEGDGALPEDLAGFADEDRPLFVEKWGTPPW